MEFPKRVARLLLLLAISGGMVGTVVGQRDSLPIAPSELPAPRPKLEFNGIMQLQQRFSLTDSIDQNGGFSADPVQSSTILRRARLKGRLTLDRHWSGYAMANLSELFSNPSGPVLEMAWVGYRHSDALRVIAGLHRPFFGIEDQYVVDVHRSIDWSKQYTAFARSGWQSFQLGASVCGDLSRGLPLPVSYAAGVYNGNGRQWQDDDNGKFWYGRLAVGLTDGVRLGLNGAMGRSRGQHGDAFAVDLQWDRQLTERWSFHLEAEYKKGSNFNQFCKAYDADPSTSVHDYRMQGLLLLPDLRYQTGGAALRSIEFSLRGEWLDECLIRPDSGLLILTPQMSFSFADDYAARLQIALVDERYEGDSALPGRRDNRRLITQLQLRF